MKYLTICAVIFATPALADFVKLAELHVDTRPAQSWGDIFWTNVPGTISAGVWNLIDVTALGVPADAKAIFLSGTLLISHANGGNLVVAPFGQVVRPVKETANLKVGFRAPDDLVSGCITCQWYVGQAVEVDTGQRSTMSTWVAVKEGMIEFRVECTDGHTSNNAVSTCGVNLNVQAWGR